MVKEKVRYKMYKAIQIFHSIEINSPGQIEHFQIRLPRNTIKVAALDEDVCMRPSLSGSPTEEATNFEQIFRKPIQFNWHLKRQNQMGQLRLQSMESARMIHYGWVTAFKWNNGFSQFGVFPITPNTHLSKSIPQKLFAPAKTTIVKGIYEDTFLQAAPMAGAYQIKLCLWVFTNEKEEHLRYEFLDYESLAEKSN
jgi:hypothetical protein